MNNDNQQICPHCGKLIEPGYYAYDKPVSSLPSHQLTSQAINEAAQNISKAVIEQLQSLAKPPRWIEVPEPLTEEQRKELEKALAKPPMIIYPEQEIPRVSMQAPTFEEQIERLNAELALRLQEMPPMCKLARIKETEGHIIPLTQLLTDEEMEVYKQMLAEEKPPVHVDVTGHLYAEPDPSHRTIAHMAQYLAPAQLDWVKSLGIDEDAPLGWGASTEVVRNLAKEAASESGWKCYMPGNHITLSVTHAGATHIQRFVRGEDNTWQLDTQE